MNALLNILKLECTLIHRHHVFTITAVSTALYVGTFYALPNTLRSYWLPAILFLEVLSLSVLLIAGLIFVERKQNTLAAYAVTPRSADTWITSKLLAFTLLPSSSGAILLALFANEFSLLALTFIILGALLYNEAGLLVALLFKDIRQYLLPICIVMGVSGISVYAYFGIYKTWLYWLLPSHSIMQGIACNLSSDTNCQNGLSLIVTTLWIAVFYISNRAVFNHFIFHQTGK